MAFMGFDSSTRGRAELIMDISELSKLKKAITTEKKQGHLPIDELIDRLVDLS